MPADLLDATESEHWNRKHPLRITQQSPGMMITIMIRVIQNRTPSEYQVNQRG